MIVKRKPSLVGFACALLIYIIIGRMMDAPFAIAVINNYGPQSFAQPTSPANSRGFPTTNSPGPIDLYTSGQDSVSYVQATSPQPTGFPPIAVSRVSTWPPLPSFFCNHRALIQSVREVKHTYSLSLDLVVM